MAKTTIDTLAADIQKILEEYETDVTEMTQEVVRKVGQKGVQALRSNSSIFNGNRYASGWSSKVETNRLGSKATLYNAKVPGLPHLLEHGHALRNGGRYAGRVHIAPVEAELEKVFTQDLEAGIQ